MEDRGVRVKMRAACEALCAEHGAQLYQLTYASDGYRMRESNGYAAHIYWPFDPADPHWNASEPIVSSYMNGSTALEATQLALSKIGHVRRNEPIKRPEKGLLGNLACLEAAIEQLGVAYGMGKP